MFRPNLISMDFIILSLGNDSLNTPILTNRCILYNLYDLDQLHILILHYL